MRTVRRWSPACPNYSKRSGSNPDQCYSRSRAETVTLLELVRHRRFVRAILSQKEVLPYKIEICVLKSTNTARAGAATGSQPCRTP